MTKFPLIATLLLTAVAAPALAQEKAAFTHDGVTYVYSQTKVGDSTIIQGHADNGPDFRYVVRNGQVTGNTDGNPVRFSVADAMAAKPQVEIVSER